MTHTILVQFLCIRIAPNRSTPNCTTARRRLVGAAARLNKGALFAFLIGRACAERAAATAKMAAAAAREGGGGRRACWRRGGQRCDQCGCHCHPHGAARMLEQRYHFRVLKARKMSTTAAAAVAQEKWVHALCSPLPVAVAAASLQWQRSSRSRSSYPAVRARRREVKARKMSTTAAAAAAQEERNE